LKVKVTKTIRISKEYDDIEDYDNARNRIETQIEDNEFTLLIACYFLSEKARVKRID